MVDHLDHTSRQSGFPVCPHIHGDDCEDLSVFSIKRADRVGRHVFQQCGNSMHVGCMSILQLHSLACISHKKLSPLLANMNLARAAIRERKRRALEDAGESCLKKRIQGKTPDPAVSVGINYL